MKDQTEVKRTGRVKWFNETKGYGFIIDDSANEEIFVHKKECNDSIREKDKVSFNLKWSEKGDQATNVTKLPAA